MNSLSEIETTTSLESSYEAAHDTAVLVDRSYLGLLKFTGQTRLDLLNRMSTQQVINLKSGEGAATILTTDIGRIIDRLILYVSSEAVYCLTSEQNSENIASYLGRFVFFMDDFQVEDVSPETAILAVYGRQAFASLSELFEGLPELRLHHWVETSLDSRPVYIHRTDPIAGDGYLVMCKMEDKAAILERLTAIITPAGDETFEYLRIESGRSRFGHELTTDYIPLEANLWPDVSFNKGCYTGQEIIARMESRGRLAKKLVRMKSATGVNVGDELTSGGKKMGTITSAADGPQGYLALGYVKTTFLEAGSPTAVDKPLMAGSTTVEVDDFYSSDSGSGLS